MNILEQTEALKDMPDAVLIQQMKMPTGQIAPIFITSELKRRKRMRDEYARREAADTPTVAEEVVMAAGMPQGGIADAARALAPKTDMGQNTGMAEMAPRAATRAPQPMASGGIVGMRQGGKLVKVGRASFYAFPDGEVFFEAPDGSREAVTDPRVLGVVREQANVGPERQDESAAPLGSEILQEAAPEAPTLESTLSSARPFSPTSTEATDTRPAVPSSLGMGGERPTIVTSPAQPSFSPELDGQGIASISTSSTGVDPFGAAQSLLPPPETDVSSMIAPPTGESAVSTAGTDKLESAIAAAQSAIDIDKTTPITLTMQQVQQAIAEGNSDILELAQQQGLLDEAIATMPAARSPKETKPLIDAGTDPRFGDTMGLQEVLAGDFDPVSDASSKPATPYVPFIPIEPRVGERSIGVDDTFSRAAAAREQGLDMPNPMPPASTDLRGDPGQYGFPQADNIAMGKSIAELDKQLKEIPSELSNVPTDLDPAGFGVQPRYDVDQLPKPVEVGTEADPVVLSEEEAVGIEAARPKAAPVALKAERDAAKLSAPDGGGITTVSTKAINDAAKSTGLGVDAWLSIAKGGAAVAASKNPTLLGALGEGAGVAASSLIAQRASDKAASLKQDQIDATLEAARIRAAAAGQRGMAPPTGSALLTYLSGQLDQAKFAREQAENDRGKGRAAEIVRLDREIADLQARIAALSPVLAASVGGTGSQAKNIDVSKG